MTKRGKRPKKERPKARLMPGEQMFELVELFDLTDAVVPRGLPMEHSQTMIRGMINDVLIVEVPKEIHGDTLEQLLKHLQSLNREALIVTEGIRFMKLRALTYAEEQTWKEKFDAKRPRTRDELEAAENPGSGPGAGQLRDGPSGGPAGGEAGAAAAGDGEDRGHAEEEADDPPG